MLSKCPECRSQSGLQNCNDTLYGTEGSDMAKDWPRKDMLEVTVSRNGSAGLRSSFSFCSKVPVLREQRDSDSDSAILCRRLSLFDSNDPAATKGSRPPAGLVFHVGVDTWHDAHASRLKVHHQDVVCSLARMAWHDGWTSR